MKRLPLLLALIVFSEFAHATVIEAGAEYEDGSTFTFVAEIDDSYVWREGNNYPGYLNALMVFTHGGYRYASRYGALSLIESASDTGTVFGDSLSDSWDSWHIDWPGDDYHFTPTYFSSSGGNIDGWRPDHSGSYYSAAVRSYLRTQVPEPGTASLLLFGIAGVLYRKRRNQGSPGDPCRANPKG